MLERHNGSHAKAEVIIMERQECPNLTNTSAIQEPTIITIIIITCTTVVFVIISFKYGQPCKRFVPNRRPRQAQGMIIRQRRTVLYWKKKKKKTYPVITLFFHRFTLPSGIIHLFLYLQSLMSWRYMYCNCYQIHNKTRGFPLLLW